MTVRTTVLTILAAVLMSTVGEAQVLYALDYDIGEPSRLFRLDPTNGAVLQEVGTTGILNATGLAVHPTTGVLYGVAHSDSFSHYTFFTVDRETGLGTPIVKTFGFVDGLAFDAEGTLYAWIGGKPQPAHTP